MATLERLVPWITEFRAHAPVSFSSFNYIQRWIPNAIDLRLESHWQGRALTGRSVALSENDGIIKSSMEFIERLAHFTNRETSISGYACHESFDQAGVNASLELVERDAVLWHHHRGIPYVRVELGPNDFPNIDYANLIAEGHKDRLEFEYFEAIPYFNDVFVIICSAKSKKSRLRIFGFGISRSSIRAAALRSLLECIQNISILTGELVEPITSFTEFKDKIFVTGRDHNFLGLDSEYVQAIEPMFVKDPGGLKPGRTPHRFSVRSFELRRLSLPTELPDASLIPAVVVKATHPELEALYLGSPRSDSKNHLPHFIG